MIVPTVGVGMLRTIAVLIGVTILEVPVPVAPAVTTVAVEPVTTTL